MRFGIREICDVVFKARTQTQIGNTTFAKGQPVLYIDTAKTSSVEGTSELVYARGGRGNPRLIAWEGERTVTFNVEDALLSPMGIAVLTGAGLIKADSGDHKMYVHTTFDLPILAGGKVIVDADTAGGEDAILYVNAGSAPIFGMVLDNAGAGVVPVATTALADGEHTVGADGIEITFDGASGYVGHTLRVDTYLVKTAGVSQITIDADNFAGNYYVEASGLFREEYSGEDMPVEIIFPNVKIQSSFTFSMANSGDPSTFNFVMDAFPDYTKFDRTKKRVVVFQIIGDENITATEEVEEDTAELSGLTISGVTLSPTFSADVTTYTGTTSTANGIITATVAEGTVEIKNGETVVTSGNSATWETGENVVTVKVTNGTATKTYTITVTKSE